MPQKLVTKNDLTAHNEWANRPDDECYPTLDALYKAVKARREISAEASVPFQKLTFKGNGTVLLEGKPPMAMSNWAFEQYQGLQDGEKPGLGWLRTVQDNGLVADILTNQARRNSRDGMQMLFSKQPNEDYGMVRSFTTESYSRLWDETAVRRTMDLVSNNPGWHNPTKTKRPGHVGLYASDRNVFIFLVNEGNRVIDTEKSKLNRGIYLWNSEVKPDRLASYGMRFFYFDEVCGNHIVWGSQTILEIRMPHVGADVDANTLAQFNRAMKTIAASDTKGDKAVFKAAMALAVGKDAVESAAWLVAQKFTQAQARLMVAGAQVVGDDPTNLWALVSAGTRLSQQRDPLKSDNKAAFVEGRAQLDERIGGLMKFAEAKVA